MIISFRCLRTVVFVFAALMSFLAQQQDIVWICFMKPSQGELQPRMDQKEINDLDLLIPWVLGNGTNGKFNTRGSEAIQKPERPSYALSGTQRQEHNLTT
ncbi:hypothetical protein V8E51_012068 [Hyaloscypha variabilis]